MANDKNSLDKLKIPEETKEKLKAIKSKLDGFKDKVLKEFNQYVIGMALLPFSKEKVQEMMEDNDQKEKPDASKEKSEKETIDVLILVDDSDSKKMSKDELHEKLFKVIEKIAAETDKNLKPIVMLLTELRESLYDGKYQILQEIALATPLHDPTDILAAIKIAEVHKGMVIKKFEKYIVSYIAAGSLFRGEKSHDIDVYIVVDDTDVKRMSRFELKDRLRNIIITMGFEAGDITGVKKTFHVQVYILTDFWESVKDANPVIFTFLRDGVPLYDRGVFMPWKLLLQMGRIRPSAEAIDMQMDVGEKLLDRAKKKFLGIAAEDVYYAVLNPSQAALMLYGINPPTPKETIRLFEEIFVKKEKLIELKYVKILENIIRVYKDIDHGKITDITGTELDKLINSSDLFIKRVKKLFEQLDKRRESESIVEIYNTCIKVAKEVLTEAKMKFSDTNLESALSLYLKKNGISEKLVSLLKEVKKARKDYQEKKLSKAEAEKVKKDARTFIRVLLEHVQRKRSFELERSKIRFKHGDKIGELLILDKVAFITQDLNEKDKKIMKISLNSDGSLGEVFNSNMQELEDALLKEKTPSKLFIKEKIFEDLKKVIGKDIEIMIY